MAEVSDKALAMMFEPIIWRQVIGGEGGIPDAIAHWRKQDSLEDANKILEELCLKLAQKARAVLTKAPLTDMKKEDHEDGN